MYNPSLPGCLSISRDTAKRQFSCGWTVWPWGQGHVWLCETQWVVLSVSPDGKFPAEMLGTSIRFVGQMANKNEIYSTWKIWRIFCVLDCPLSQITEAQNFQGNFLSLILHYVLFMAIGFLIFSIYLIRRCSYQFSMKSFIYNSGN